MADLALPLDLAAVGQARAWVDGQLGSWSESGRSRAVLVTSELVANGVIHARTELSLHLEVEDDCARLEVSDGSPDAPATKRYDRDAATGRGLRLVGQLSEEWGARPSPGGGKTVWAVIRDLPWDVTGPEGAPDIEIARAPRPARSAAGVAVRLIDIPLSLLLAAQQHNDALMRELVFVTGSGHLSARLDALAGAVTEHFSAATDVSSAIEAAVAGERATLDLTVRLSESGWTSMLELSALLDEADLYCERMELLTLASSPVVREFRHWYRDQVQAQSRGLPPTRWPG